MSIKENEWFIEVPWGRICVVAWGSCLDPPVLLCHGSLDSAATYRPLVQLLPQKFYYIAVELPGNGRSDRLPPGLMIAVYDLVAIVDLIVKHFRWDSFHYIGHSLGACIGKMYNISIPDKINKLIEIDPINFLGTNPEQFSIWYQTFFTNYYDNYESYNTLKERTPKISRAEAVEKIRSLRGISEENAIATLERWSEITTDGLLRNTLDKRYRLISLPPLTPEHIKKIFTSLKTPTLALVSKRSLNKGLYRNTKFLIDESIYPNKNFRSIIIDGNHDLHLNNVEEVARFVGLFLLGGVEGLDCKAKL